MVIVPDWMYALAEQARTHIMPPDEFGKWLDRHIEQGAGPHWHQDDLEDAFAAGFQAAIVICLSAVRNHSEVVTEETSRDTQHDHDAGQRPAPPLQAPDSHFMV